MKKKITIACLVGSAILILDSFGAPQAVMMFFLAGVIPGTNIAIDASIMMEVFFLLSGVVVGRLTNHAFRSLQRLPQISRA